MQLSNSARVAATADITRRSAFFAIFNARLNGRNIESYCGDLYAPVLGRQFDLITAHPPFVPATGERMVYRDGGDSGEEVTRRVVEGLPEYLRPDGMAVILCVASDTHKENFEVRARAWLGAAADEFDVVYGLEKILTVEEVVESMRKRGQQIDDAVAGSLYERLRTLGTRQFVYGALFLRRFAKPIVSAPLRLQLTQQGIAADFERVFKWREFTRTSGFNAALAASRPVLAPNLELTIRHVMQEGELVPAEFIFRIDAGFQAALRLDGWLVPLVARLTGDKSVQEVFAAAQTADELPPRFNLEAFLDLIQRLLDLGFMQLAREET